MRILMAMAGLGGGGAEGFFERLAAAFRDHGHPISVAIRPHAERVARLTDAGVPIETLRFGGPLDLHTRYRLRNLIKQEAPDVVLSFMSRAAGFVPAPGDRFVHVARLGGYYALKNFKSADHLVCNTQDICDWLIAAGAEPDKVSHIPNFVDKGDAAPLSRAKVDTPADAPLVVALGRLHTNKAFDVLLEAMALQPSLWLWLAGDGPERAALEARATALGIGERVRFLGWLERPGPAIAAADIVAVPSRHEPLGNVVLEAWSYGKPVVAAASTGPAALIDNGVDGLLVPVDDASALATVLAEATGNADVTKVLGAAGMTKLGAGFAPALIVQQYIELFDSLLKRKMA